MGGLGPGIGGFELVVLGIVALLVVGPKDLPILMRRIGQMVAKARGMANEFRASFDEMARQSELDDLRKEVESLRKGQGMYPLGEEAEAAFKSIETDLNKPIESSAKPVSPPAEVTAEPVAPAISEWPEESGPVTTPEAVSNAEAKPKAKAAAKPKTAKSSAKAAQAKKAAPKASAGKPRARTTRSKAVDL